jgi:hypothetical protein
MRVGAVLSIIMCMFLLGALVTPLRATAQTGVQSDDAQVLTVGVYIINIGKIDLQVGSYDLDFYFWLSSDDPEVDFTKERPTFDFMNSMNARVEPSRLEPNYYEE